MIDGRAGFDGARPGLRHTAVLRSAMLPGCLPGSTRWERAELGLSILLIGELQWGERTERAQSNAIVVLRALPSPSRRNRRSPEVLGR